MALIEGVQDRHCPNKSWGWEEWIVNNDLYCGKRLHFEKLHGATSLHFHMRKHETMYVERGWFIIYTHDPSDGKVSELHLRQGDSLVIEPGTPHRIEAQAAGSILVEFSTHHEDSDSYRIHR